MGYRENPCLSSYDTEGTQCALCRDGAVRILVEASLEEGEEAFKFIGCGSVRSPERTSAGRYEFFDWVNFEFNWTDILAADEKFQCYLDPYYELLTDDDTYKYNAAYNLDKKYYPTRYFNHTTSALEFLCIAKEDWGITDASCESTYVYPDLALMDYLRENN